MRNFKKAGVCLILTLLLLSLFGCASYEAPDILGEPIEKTNQSARCDHGQTLALEEVAATCTTAGKTAGTQCALCGEILTEQKIIPAAGHRMVSGVCAICGMQEASGLSFRENGDHTCTVVGPGSFLGETLAVPSVSPSGSSVVAIADSAFSSETAKNLKIRRLTIPGSVKTVGVSAFEGCGTLSEVVLENGVMSIGARAFANCKNLKSLSIPDSLMTIEDTAFLFCLSLSDVGVEENNLRFSAKDRGLYGDGGKTLIQYIGGKVNSSFEVPDEVTKIAAGAFAGHTELESFSILFNVTEIGEDAFFETAYYDSPENYTDGVLYIDSCLIKADPERVGAVCTTKTNTVCVADAAFADCKELTGINLSSAVVSVGKDAFRNCGKLKYNEDTSARYLGNGANPYAILMEVKSADLTLYNVKDNARIINRDAFFGCKKLASVSLPSTLTDIGNSAFEGCESLSSITIREKVVSIGNRAFFGCSGLQHILIGNSLENIGSEAFCGCELLTGITLPAATTTIGYRAFAGCTHLADILVGNGNEHYKSISGSLYSVDGLTLIQYALGRNQTDLTLPDDVEIIGEYAFSGCSELKSVTLADTVTRIEAYAFEDCDHLEYLVTPASLETIAAWAFSGTTCLSAVYSAGTESDLAAVAIGPYNDTVEEAQWYFYLEEEIDTDGYFWYWTEKNKVDRPAVWTTLLPASSGLAYRQLGNGTCAVSGIGTCTDLVITIPEKSPEGDTVVEILSGAFSGQKSITDLSIPKTIVRVGENAFPTNGSLRYYEYENGFYLGSPENRYLVLVRLGDREENFKLHEKSVAVVEGALAGSSIESVSLPSGFVELSDRMFADCAELTSLSLPSTLKKIGNNALKNCSSLGSIALPQSLTEIGESAFENCTKLVEIRFPNSLETVGDSAFCGCESLRTVYLGENTDGIDDSTFADCPALRSVAINGNNGNYTMVSGCLCASGGTELILAVSARESAEVTVPNTVTKIDAEAFRYAAVQTCRIPGSVTVIGNHAFSDCKSLSKIIFSGTEEAWNAIKPTDFPNCVMEYRQ